MTEFVEIMQRYGHELVPLSEWLGTDIARLIELMDAELQRRTDNHQEDGPAPWYEDDGPYDPYGYFDGDEYV